MSLYNFLKRFNGTWNAQTRREQNENLTQIEQWMGNSTQNASDAKNIAQAADGKAQQAVNVATQKGNEAIVIATEAKDKSNDVQQQLNTIVIESGTSDAEVLQARGGKPTLNDRLTETEQTFSTQLAQNTDDIASKVELAKVVEGGQIPAPLRVPVITLDKSFPNVQSPYEILYAKGNEMYATSKDLTLRHTSNGGAEWNKVAYQSNGFSGTRCFLKLNDGTILYISNANAVMRKTPSQSTFTNVLQMRTGTQPLGTQSWAVDKKTGHIYLGEYNTTAHTERYVYRSTDNGETWHIFKSFNTRESSETQRISHIHAIQYDPYSERIYVMIGDATDWTGIWRVNADGTDLEKVVTNDMLSSQFYDAPRSIGFMPFENYIVWAGDTTMNPYVFRMARSEIGKSNPTIERMYRLNSTAWFTCKASVDGKTWIITASEEGNNSIDNLVHIYAVTDEGATIFEVGTLVAPEGVPAGSLMPLSEPDIYNDNFWLTTRAFETSYTYKFRAGLGFNPIDKPAVLPRYRITQSVNTAGITEVPPNGEIIFAHSLPKTFARRLYLLEAGVQITDNGGVSSNYLQVIIRKQGNPAAFSYQYQSLRHSERLEYANEIASQLFTSGDVIEFVIKNTHATATQRGTANVTFAWGEN